MNTPQFLSDSQVQTIRDFHPGQLIASALFDDDDAKHTLLLCAMPAFINYNTFAPDDPLTSIVLAIPYRGSDTTAFARLALIKRSMPVETELSTVLLHAIPNDTGTRFGISGFKPLAMRKFMSKVMLAKPEAPMKATLVPLQALRNLETYMAWAKEKTGK